jgi:DNA-binding CsgD family transcriptional regulator/PAS domain-containing protein
MGADAGSFEAERLSDLIGAIYDCVLDPSRWDATLDEVRQFLDCANVVLALLDLRTDTVRLQKTLGIEPYWLAKMAEHSSDLAKLYRTVPDLLTRDIDEPIQGDRKAILMDPYYVEWGKPQGLIDWIALFLMRSPNRFAKIWLARHESLGVITDREIRLLRLLAPHLRRAVTITDLIDMKSIEAEALDGTLDTLAVGILLVAEDGAILHANRAAASMLDRERPIAATLGKIRAGDLYTTDRLRSTIALAARNEGGIGASGIGIALSGPTGDVATAHVLPLARGDLRTRLMPRAAAAVFVASDLRLPLARLDAIAEAFGLTRAETRLLDRLVRGDSIADAAAAMSIAMTTAKTHRSRLLAKTRMRRQTSLISLVHRLLPPVGAADTGPADVDAAAAFDKTARR